MENAGYVGLIVNFKKTKALFLNCEPTSLIVLEEEVAPVEDFCYLGSMKDIISSGRSKT